MLTLPADLYDPGPYSEPGGFPLWYARGITKSLSGSTFYAVSAIEMSRGNVIYTTVPPTSLLYVIEARALIQRASGGGILDSFGWGMFTSGAVPAQVYSFSGLITALGADSTRAASANNAFISDVCIVRDVLIFPDEQIGVFFNTASDVTLWNLQMFVRGFVIPRGNVAAV